MAGDKRIIKVFYRYLLSYFFVLLIPLMFIVIFNLRFLRSDLEDYILRETRYRFEQIVGEMVNEPDYEAALSAAKKLVNG